MTGTEVPRTGWKNQVVGDDNVIEISTPTGYCFTFIRQQCEVLAEAIHANGRGVSAELTVYFGKEELITSALLNLQDTRAIKNFLDDLIRGHYTETIIDWDLILYHVITRCLRKYRIGEPAVEVRSIKVSETHFQVYPMIQSNQITNLYGKPGSGKTVLGELIAILIQDGFAFENLVPTPGNVLYLDYESDPETIRERIDALRAGIGTTISPEVRDILYRKCTTPIIEDIYTVQDIAAKKDVDVVIVDGFGYAIGGDSQKEERVIQAINALRSLNRTAILIDHDAKTGDSETPYGNTYKVAGARDLFYLKGNQEENLLQLGIIHKKRNRGRKIKPFALEFEFIGDDPDKPTKIVPRVTDINNLPDMGNSIPRWMRIKTLLLDEGAMTASDIAHSLEDSLDVVKKELSVRKNVFCKVEGKKWGVSIQSGI